MTENQALQIANLLNERNQLTTAYTANSILASEDRYVFYEETKIVVACAEIKKVQWYQWEIRHVSVHEKFERRGYGRRILQFAERKVKDNGGLIAQCTVRADNHSSIMLFLASDYIKAISFFNKATGNYIQVFQKSLVTDY